jgi:hypothetical protein
MQRTKALEELHAIANETGFNGGMVSRESAVWILAHISESEQRLQVKATSEREAIGVINSMILEMESALKTTRRDKQEDLNAKR